VFDITPGSDASIGWFDWLNLGIGLAALAVGVAALFYAFKAAGEAREAAEQSRKILFRSVVIPYRNLDRKHAQLGPREAELLASVYKATPNAASYATAAQIAARVSDHVRPTNAELAYLTEEGWLENHAEGWCITKDRRDYMAFLRRIEDESEDA
jgi:hypothetical protein